MVLSDPEPAVRVGAVRAVASLAPQMAEATLRQKIAAGDTSSEVMDECFRALIQVNREDSIPLIATFLLSREVGEYAAFALGESRDSSALEILKQAYHERLQVRQVLIQAIGLVRSRDTVDFLIDVIRDDNETNAEVAYNAMESYGDSDYKRARQAFIDRI